MLQVNAIQGCALGDIPEVQVSFPEKALPDEQVIQQLKTIDSTKSVKVITWFIKDKPLNRKWMERLSVLVQAVRSLFNDRQIALYNLYSWNILAGKSDGKLIGKTGSKVFAEIERLNLPDVMRIDSLDFFQFLQMQETSEKVNDYVNSTIWKRPFLQGKSTSQTRRSGRRLNEVLQCGITRGLSEVDTEAAYSPLQYLEGYFLIERLVRGCSDKPCEVVFLLPNREMDYYDDQAGSFAQDVAALLRLREVALYENRLSVRFLTFEWGDGKNQRPYLVGDVKPSQVTHVVAGLVEGGSR